MNFTVPRWLHLVLYVACLAITSAFYLASKGNITLTASTAGILSLVLATINSVDPATVISKATPAQIEVAAKRLPPEAIARLAEYQRIKSV